MPSATPPGAPLTSIALTRRLAALLAVGLLVSFGAGCGGTDVDYVTQSRRTRADRAAKTSWLRATYPPDRDEDGVPDVRDRCPTQKEDRDGFQDADGCPDPDNDRDGIADTRDRCPMKAEDRDGFQDTDGCPDPDNDRDGVPDTQDRCPNQRGAKDGRQPGCPTTGVVFMTTRVVAHVTRWFDAGKATLTPDAKKAAAQLGASWRARSKGKKLRVLVHGPFADADCGATPCTTTAIQQLGSARAAALAAALTAAGVPATSLQSVALGRTQPLLPCAQDDAAKRQTCLARNTRVELLLTR